MNSNTPIKSIASDGLYFDGIIDEKWKKMLLHEHKESLAEAILHVESE